MRRIIWSVLAVCWSGLAAAVSPDSTDADAIMAAAEARPTPTSQVAKLSIVVSDKAGRTRQRGLRSFSKTSEGMTRQLLMFESPADVRNSGLLSWDRPGAEVDDQWLYLPSLKRTSRLGSSDRSGSFMGTDLTYADMTRRDPKAYSYSMVKPSDTVDGRDCWVIEARVVTDAEKKETGYLKRHVWVDKKTLVVLRSKAWVIKGQKLKYSSFTDLEQIGGYWIAKKATVRTVSGGETVSESVLLLSDLAVDVAIDDATLTTARLERGL